MAIGYTVNWETQGTSTALAAITSTSRTYNSGELVIVLYINEDQPAPGGAVYSISNSGAAQTWTQIAGVSVASDCGVSAWRCVMSVTQAMTITAQDSRAEARRSAIAVIPHTGFNATTPVPAGNIFSGSLAADVSQSITPTETGSALWMIQGDWNQTDSFVALANNTLDQTVNVAGAYTGVLIRPTTQPRTDAAAFTIGATDTGGAIAWLAFEVQADSTPADYKIAWITA